MVQFSCLTLKVSKYQSSFNKNVGSAGSFLQSVNVDITDSQFHNNWTPLDGGAINAFVSEAALRNVSFIENTAKGNGGSVYFVVNSILTFYKCIFSKNNALYQGGGIWSLNSKLVIKHSDFYRNLAEANAGGAIFAQGGYLYRVRDLELSNCSFYGHVAGDGGSIDISENKDAILTQCKFIANSAVGDGGAIQVIHQ